MCVRMVLCAYPRFPQGGPGIVYLCDCAAFCGGCGTGNFNLHTIHTCTHTHTHRANAPQCFDKIRSYSGCYANPHRKAFTAHNKSSAQAHPYSCALTADTHTTYALIASSFRPAIITADSHNRARACTSSIKRTTRPERPEGELLGSTALRRAQNPAPPSVSLHSAHTHTRLHPAAAARPQRRSCTRTRLRTCVYIIMALFHVPNAIIMVCPDRSEQKVSPDTYTHAHVRP